MKSQGIPAETEFRIAGSCTVTVHGHGDSCCDGSMARFRTLTKSIDHTNEAYLIKVCPPDSAALIRAGTP